MKILMNTQEPRSDFNDSPLLFWHTSYTRYPELLTLANRYLTPPISSVASEREFKVARDIANGNTVRLRPQNVQKLVILKYNLRAIGCNSVLLPQSVVADSIDSRDVEQQQVEVIVGLMKKCLQQKNKYLMGDL